MGKLEEQFIVPPMSVFDTKQGYWQQRKREWKEIGLQGEIGRDDSLLCSGLKELAKKQGNKLTGTSIFDPVLCEVIYNWFCFDKGIIFDPFAGGSTRGVVAEKLGRRYIGIDLSEKQVDANQINADKLGVCPAWHCDDSRNADRIRDKKGAYRGFVDDTKRIFRDNGLHLYNESILKERIVRVYCYANPKTRKICSRTNKEWRKPTQGIYGNL